jgi:hypothetical protein
MSRRPRPVERPQSTADRDGGTDHVLVDSAPVRVEVIDLLGRNMIGVRVGYHRRVVAVMRTARAWYDAIPIGDAGGTWWVNARTGDRIIALLRRQGHPITLRIIDCRRPDIDPGTDPVLTPTTRPPRGAPPPPPPLTWEALEALGLDPTTGRPQ